MIELFTSRRDATWRVAWRQFDEFGVLVGEGVVRDPSQVNEKAAKRRLRSMWVDLLAARFELDMVGEAICVGADRHDVERAIGRRLLPDASAKVVV